MRLPRTAQRSSRKPCAVPAQKGEPVSREKKTGASDFRGLPLILASTSPRRRDLLTEAGYRFEVIPADVNEITPVHFTVSETVLFNAKVKAEEVAQRRSDALVIGADTLVALEGNALGKPRDLCEAFEMLSQLSGREHEVFSGVWLACLAGKQLSLGFVEVSRVRFRKLSAKEIREYMTRINPLDKAGAYAAQEDPMGIIAGIEGSRTNVIGLPMEALSAALRRL